MDKKQNVRTKRWSVFSLRPTLIMSHWHLTCDCDVPRPSQLTSSLRGSHIWRFLEFDLEDLKTPRVWPRGSEVEGVLQEQEQLQEQERRSSRSSRSSRSRRSRRNSVKEHKYNQEGEGEVRRNDPGTFIPDSPQRTWNSENEHWVPEYSIFQNVVHGFAFKFQN